jgi:predicted O-methyltransferase YrrM
LEFLLRCSYFNIRLPIVLGARAIEYDLANILIDEMIGNPRRTILELGSGKSTAVLAAFAAALNNDCEIVSVEGDQHHFVATTNELAKLGISSNNLQLLVAPYKEVSLNGREWRWYDLSCLESIKKPIDLLLVDGPPGDMQTMSRYPALPLLWNKLSNDCVIVLDDGDRPDEKQVARQWLKDFSQLQAEFIDTYKGTWIFRKSEV